jgi:L-fuculose-phosphate aldolase
MEEKLREELLACANKLVKKGLIYGTWGNLSVRLDNKYMLITPSGMDYTRLTPSDMVKVSIDTLKYDKGQNVPSSEEDLHSVIYTKRSDVGAILHTHSKFCCVFAAACKDMPVVEDYVEDLGQVIKVSERGIAGTKDLAEKTMKALGDRKGAIIANHGMVACGKDLDDAFENCLKLEENAKKYLLTL